MEALLNELYGLWAYWYEAFEVTPTTRMKRGRVIAGVIAHIEFKFPVA